MAGKGEDGRFTYVPCNRQWHRTHHIHMFALFRRDNQHFECHIKLAQGLASGHFKSQSGEFYHSQVSGCHMICLQFLLSGVE